MRRVGNAFELSEPARKTVATFAAAKGPQRNVDSRVDHPEAFVVMPFGRPLAEGGAARAIKRSCAGPAPVPA